MKKRFYFILEKSLILFLICKYMQSQLCTQIICECGNYIGFSTICKYGMHLLRIILAFAIIFLIFADSFLSF